MCKDEGKECRLDRKENDSETLRSGVPDGGWGWVVVVSTLTFNTIYDGCSYSFGIFYTDLLDYFGDTKSNTAWIGSLFFSVPLLCAPLASIITGRLGSRKATMLGGVIASLGFAVGTFSNSVWMLTIFYGLFGGFGMSLPYFNSLKVVTDYFDKRLALASGVAESGAGLGTVIFAPFTEYLVSNFGWRGALLILSGIVANVVVCGALFKPVNHTLTITVDEETKILSESSETFDKGTSSDTLEETEMLQKSEKCCDNHSLEEHASCANIPKTCLSRFKSIPFMLFFLSNFMMYLWYDVPYVFMVDRATGLGIPSQKASYLLSVIGFVHLLGIIVYGIIGDWQRMNRKLLYGFSTALCGVSIMLVPFFTNYIMLAVLAGCFGLFSASVEALLSCVLIDIVGKKAFDNFYCGLILFTQGFANLIGPPLAGLLYDYTSKYDSTFYTAGGCVVTAGCLYFTICRTSKTDLEDLSITAHRETEI